MKGFLKTAGWVIGGVLVSILLLVIVVGIIVEDTVNVPEAAVTDDQSTELATSAAIHPSGEEDSTWQTYIAAVRAVRELPPAEKLEMEFHIEILGAMKASFERISEDKVIDDAEAQHICYVHPQWTAQLREAEKYIVSLDEPDLKGWLIDIQNYRELVDQTALDCGDAPVTPSEPPIEQDSTKTPGVGDAWDYNRDRDVVIERVGDKELAEELLSDPCFMGMGPIGAIWDMECQMRR